MDNEMLKNVNESVLNDLSIDSSVDKIERVTLDRADIFRSIDFKSDEDRYLCELIINDYEKQVAQHLNDCDISLIPYIGRVRRSLKTMNKKTVIKPKGMFDAEFKEYLPTLRKLGWCKMDRNSQISRFLRRLKTANQVTYTRLASSYGVAHANMYLASIIFLREVPFDEEWQNQYLELEKKEE